MVSLHVCAKCWARFDAEQERRLKKRGLHRSHALVGKVDDWDQEDLDDVKHWHTSDRFICPAYRVPSSNGGTTHCSQRSIFDEIPDWCPNKLEHAVAETLGRSAV
jgi:hypothetical protein